MTAPVPDHLQSSLGSSYTLERELGRGGMATVYLARDVKHRRLVAFKVLHADLAATLGPERFRREIATAAQLHHPHILPVLDSGETADRQLWFTMPYVEGESLRQRLEREHQLSVPDALRITLELSAALDYAHQRGIIHRDVKPENVMLTTQDDALLADFGIARAVTASTDDPSLTDTGLALGTPQYMSPEQASGDRALDARSDVYSLGALCYEMLTGEPPFVGRSVQAVLAKMLSSMPPPVRVLRPGAAPALDRVVLRALARVPADRYATAGAFARALAAAEQAGTHAAAGGRRRRVLAGVALLGLVCMVGAGALVAWRARIRHASSTGSVVDTGPASIRLAVLPFENLGDSADAYFADGVTDAVRGKLTNVPGLAIIGSASSGQYRHTTKAPRLIARELGVRYLLVGKVRWDKHPGGESQVQVSPELVDATTATDQWSQPFDAPLTRVFDVQADIAGKVARALQIALTPATEQTLASRPTANLAAYDAFLRGQAAGPIGTQAGRRRAIAAHREAVTLDSGFALAWSALGGAYAMLYFNGPHLPALADSADRATARAVALAPDLPEAHAARSIYFGNVMNDNIRSLAEAEAGLARGPNASLLRAAANAEERLGRWDAAAAHAAHATELDPRSPITFSYVADIALRRQRPAEARAALDRALALRPENLPDIQGRAIAALQTGDLAGAQAASRAVPASVDPAALVAYWSSSGDLGWALDGAQERQLLAFRPDAFDGDTAAWAIALAQQYSFHGDRERLTAYADTARRAFESLLRATPADDQARALYGLALAYLGRRAEAIRQGEQAIAVGPTSQDALVRPYLDHQLARIYIVSGQPDRALEVLERLIKEPYYLTPAWLGIDPNFAALRGNPRFERLAAGDRPIS